MIDDVVPEMRQRLLTNRHGKLTAGQWLDVVTAPVLPFLVLVAPAILIFGTRLLIFSARWLWLVGIFCLIAAVAVTVMRAYQYARAPLYFSKLYTRQHVPMFWQFWKHPTMFNENGEIMCFTQRLSPFARLKPNTAYDVYYLKQKQEYILSSIALADHPDANQWQPSAVFETRMTRRSQPE